MAFHRDYPFAVNSSPKAVKAQAYGYLNAIHYLAPADTSGINLCPKASAGCKALCLGWHSGQSGMVSHDAQINSTRQSRLDKTRRFMRDRKAYLADIVRQIERQQRLAAKRGFKLCVSLEWRERYRVGRHSPCRRQEPIRTFPRCCLRGLHQDCLPVRAQASAELSSD